MSWNIDLPKAEYFDWRSPNLESLVREVTAQKELAIDSETTGLTVWKDLPLYWSLAWGSRRITLHASVLPYFQEAFADPYKNWIFANAKYDTHMFANVGINIAGRLVDTCVMHALLYEDRPHGLKAMAMHLLGWKWSDFQDTFGKISKNNSPEHIIKRAEQENFPLLVEYAANDSWGTLQCYYTLKQQLERAHTYSLFAKKPPYIETLWDLFSKVEVPYTKVLWKNERNGILVDRERLEEIGPKLIEDIARLERQIQQKVSESGYPGVFDPTDAKLRDYFFNYLKLTPVKMTKGGKSGIRQPSVDAHSLERLAETNQVAKLTLDLRELEKLHSTFVKGIYAHCDPNGRIHTRLNQDVARTGRLSSSDPNLQTIPNPENDKWKLRDAFIAPPGKRMVVLDYSQLEMRLLACASREPGMIEVFKNGWDVHMGNASLINNIPYDEIVEAKKIDKKVKNGELPESALTARMHECLQARLSAKTIGFGLVYGMGPKKLANSLGISVPQAEHLTRRFMERMPAVEEFAKEAIAEAEQYGYSFTILGRRRNVPEIRSSRRDERMRAERIAKNTQIQGSAADVVKMAQLLCDKASLEYRYGCIPLLQIHDELIFECPAETADEAMAEIKVWMEHPFFEDLDVPLEVDGGHGTSWLKAK